jgi:serine/threonine protein kinase
MPVMSPDPLTASLKELCDTSAADISTLYSVHDVLGEGRFSRVYAAVDERNGQVLALKELDMSAIAEDEEAFDMLKAEVLALRRAGNAPHIVRLHEVIASSDAIWLAMERVPGRELFEVVSQRGALENGIVRHLMQQLLTALTALAEVGVVHRDVKPENIMVSDEETERPHLTLIDFGYAALLCEAADGGGGPMELTGVAGSPEYAAPEVLSWIEAEADATGEVEGEPYDAGCDVWSVGVTAHVLLCAAMPFELPEEATEAALVAAARNVDLSFHSRPELEGDAMAPTRDFVRACMTVARRERPSAEQLLGHPWILGSNLGTNLGHPWILGPPMALNTARLEERPSASARPTRRERLAAEEGVSTGGAMPEDELVFRRQREDDERHHREDDERHQEEELEVRRQATMQRQREDDERHQQEDDERHQQEEAAKRLHDAEELEARRHREALAGTYSGTYSDAYAGATLPNLDQRKYGITIAVGTASPTRVHINAVTPNTAPTSCLLPDAKPLPKVARAAQDGALQAVNQHELAAHLAAAVKSAALTYFVHAHSQRTSTSLQVLVGQVRALMTSPMTSLMTSLMTPLLAVDRL